MVVHRRASLRVVGMHSALAQTRRLAGVRANAYSALPVRSPAPASIAAPCASSPPFHSSPPQRQTGRRADVWQVQSYARYHHCPAAQSPVATALRVPPTCPRCVSAAGRIHGRMLARAADERQAHLPCTTVLLSTASRSRPTPAISKAAASTVPASALRSAMLCCRLLGTVDGILEEAEHW